MWYMYTYEDFTPTCVFGYLLSDSQSQHVPVVYALTSWVCFIWATWASLCVLYIFVLFTVDYKRFRTSLWPHQLHPLMFSHTSSDLLILILVPAGCPCVLKVTAKPHHLQTAGTWCWASRSSADGLWHSTQFSSVFAFCESLLIVISFVLRQPMADPLAAALPLSPEGLPLDLPTLALPQALLLYPGLGPWVSLKPTWTHSPSSFLMYTLSVH